MSQHEDIAEKPKQERQRDWQARKVAEHWEKVEPLVQKPAVVQCRDVPTLNRSPSRKTSERERDWQARKIKEHWETVEPLGRSNISRSVHRGLRAISL